MVQAYSSWKRKRLRKRLEGQIKRRNGKQKKSNLPLIAIVLFGSYFLYDHLTQDNSDLLTNIEEQFNTTLSNTKNSDLVAMLNQKRIRLTNEPEPISIIKKTTDSGHFVENNIAVSEVKMKNTPSESNRKPSPKKVLPALQYDEKDLGNLENLYREELNSLTQ